MNPAAQNNFDLLRLLAATIVFFSHCWVVLGLEEPLEKITGGLSFGRVGLLVFFLISGFLITASWKRNPRPWRFLWKRVLRIFPALFIVSLFAAFLVGVLETSFSLSNYFSSSETYSFVANNMFLNTIGKELPGVFAANPIRIVDEPLWTLPIEFLAYLLVLVVGCFLNFYRNAFPSFKINKYLKIFFALIVFGMALNLSLLLKDELHVFGSREVQFLWLLIVFSSGSLLFLSKDKILNSFIFKGKLKNLVLLAAALTWVLSWHTVLLPEASVFLFGIITFRIAYSQSTLLSIIRKKVNKADLSYGIYIYGFIFQQIVVARFPAATVLEVFLLAAPLTVLAAFLSWKYIESSALRLKNKF